MSTTSLLQTALQNLHVSQQAREQSTTPLPPRSAPGSPRSAHHRDLAASSSDTSSPPMSEDEEDELVKVGKGTAPATPVPGHRGIQLGQRLSSLGGKRDPLRTLPTHLAVRIFLQLDIRTLARCDRVCKRWHKSSTLNYVWFLHNRALILPASFAIGGNGKNRKLDDGEEFFDPYDKTPRLSALPAPTLPSSTTPVWSKSESKKEWKSTFRGTLKRSDPNAVEEIDPRRVDIESLHTSGTSTPSGRSYAGMGSGGASKWAAAGEAGMSSTERKIAAREGYRALGGRKSRAKRKMGGELGGKDKGGAVDDGRFDAPW